MQIHTFKRLIILPAFSEDRATLLTNYATVWLHIHSYKHRLGPRDLLTLLLLSDRQTRNFGQLLRSINKHDYIINAEYSRVLNRLVKHNYIQNKPDNRQSNYSITLKGYNLLKKLSELTDNQPQTN